MDLDPWKKCRIGIRLNHADPSDPDSQRCCRPIGIIRLKNTFLSHFLREEGGIKRRRCGGLVVSVPASRSPVPGSNLGVGIKVLKTRPRWAVRVNLKII